jgi:hypothetical protein
MPQYIDAYGFFVTGMAPCFVLALLLFMLKKKWPTIFHELLLAFFGVAFNMLTFLRVKPYFHLGIRDYGDHL